MPKTTSKNKTDYNLIPVLEVEVCIEGRKSFCNGNKEKANWADLFYMNHNNYWY